MIRVKETRIDYKSPTNGYSGSLYGKKSLRILDPYGNDKEGIATLDVWVRRKRG